MTHLALGHRRPTCVLRKMEDDADKDTIEWHRSRCLFGYKPSLDAHHHHYIRRALSGYCQTQTSSPLAFHQNLHLQSAASGTTLPWKFIPPSQRYLNQTASKPEACAARLGLAFEDAPMPRSEGRRLEEASVDKGYMG